MIPYVYCILMTIMLVLLYWAGIQLKHEYKICSISGILAMLAFTLNEGLRFGRGIDYNLYWDMYVDTYKGWDFDQNVGFLLFEKCFIFFGLPYQSFILFMSFMFIFATLMLMKHYKEVVMYALPLWVFYSKDSVANMVRWYLAYSFILIGLSYLLKTDKKRLLYYVSFSLIGSTIHYAIFPIPLIFYLVSLREKPLLSPKIGVALFLFIAIFYEAGMLLPLANVLTILSQLPLFVKFGGYGNSMEFWLTDNALGKEAHVGFFMAVQFCLLIVAGYYCCQKSGKKYVFAYNLFLIGALLYMIGINVELLFRYMNTFYFFMAIVFCDIIRQCKFRLVPYHLYVLTLCCLLLLKSYYSALNTPFKKYPQLSMYVWDHKNETSYTMLQVYLMQKYKDNKDYIDKDERKKLSAGKRK